MMNRDMQRRRVISPVSIYTLSVFTFLILFAPFGDAQAQTQWATNGNNINNTNTGNVGVGTNTPNEKLTVATPGNTDFRIRSSGANNPYGLFRLVGVGGTPYFQIQAGDDVAYRSLILNDYGGNVGIGTASPGAKLAVTANTALGTSSFTITPDGTNNYYAGNNHDALFVDGSLMAPHGNYTSAIVRLLRLRAQTGLDTLTIGRTGDMLVTPETRFAPYTLRLGPDASNSYYAGTDYDILQISGTGLNAHGVYTGKTLRLIRATNASGGDAFVLTREGNATFGGNVTVAGNIAAKYQDVAEWVPSRQRLAAGTVVVLDSENANHVVSATRAYDTRVAGVVSSRPGITLGEAGEGKVPVATTGRVTVKVDATRAPIRVGDLLVTSDKEGRAMRSEPLYLGSVPIHRPGTLIGKALEPLERGVGEILVLLSLQ